METHLVYIIVANIKCCSFLWWQVEPGSTTISEVKQVNRGQAARRTTHVKSANNFMGIQFMKYCFSGKGRVMQRELS